MSDKAREVFSKALEDLKDEDVTVRVQGALREMNKQILREFPLELRLNCLIGLVYQTIEEGVGTNFELVNELLRDEEDPYAYNLMREISSLEELVSLRDEIVEAMLVNGDFRKCTCKKCKESFNLSFGEVEFYRKKNFPLPKTCKYCKKGIEKPKMQPKREVSSPKEEEHIPTAMEIALRGIKLN